jgi:hypothetical protein
MRIPRWLLIPFILIGALYWTQSLWKGNKEPSFFDLPKTLEEEILMLEIFPVSNVNDVPVFTTGKGGNEEDKLYITPASDTVSIPENYHELKDSGYTIRVHGRFFKGHAIPAEYLRMKPKPERLRVFQFDRLEMVPPRNNS